MTAPTPQDRICVIFNPTAKGDRARRSLRRMQAFPAQCELKPTTAAGTARTLAAEAVREGYGTVVAMGGDGTVNEVLNGLADEPDGLVSCRFGVLPAGTVNVFARELGLPFHFARAWEVICRGRERTIDLPCMEYQTAEGRGVRWFAQMAGCGLDARAVELVEWRLKKAIGQFAYVVAGVKALRERVVQIRAASGVCSCSGQLVLIGNGRLYGGPIPVFERAELQDGLLDVCVFPKVNWWVILRYACAYLSPRFLARGRELHFQTETVRLESDWPVPVEVDGEWVGRLPAVCSLRPRALRVIVP